MIILAYLVILFGLINLLRMTLFLVGSDIYGLHAHLKAKKSGSSKSLPRFSVVIPAHNEEGTVLKNLQSVFTNDYPHEKLQVIFVDDGSTDKTLSIVRDFKTKNNFRNLIVVSEDNRGKAFALNTGMRDFATGELVMCLDADSYLDKNALVNAAKYFEDPKVAALAANVKIIETDGLLNLIQKFEYLICYQMKRAQTVFNIEYIVGGIGSTFRRKVIKNIGFYDGDTVTEDIDITMKILKNGNKSNRVIYGANVIAHTVSAIDIKGLLAQRYRWKYGRTQTFWKNRKMFFNPDAKYTKGLTFAYLPLAIFFDIAFFLEPLVIAFLLFLIIIFGDIKILLSAFLVISTYISINILAEETISFKDKFKLLLIAPTMYFLFYILSYVEYIALIRAIANLKYLKKSISKSGNRWVHIERPKLTVT